MSGTHGLKDPPPQPIGQNYIHRCENNLAALAFFKYCRFKSAQKFLFEGGFYIKREPPYGK
jgi:hypothetical protein